MSSTLSTQERLNAARKKFEELKKRHNFPLSKSGSSSKEHQIETVFTDSTVSNTPDNELSETIEIQKQEIKKLRDQNAQLQSERSDLKGRVVVLEKQINELKAGSQLKADGIEEKSSEEIQTTTVEHLVAENEKSIKSSKNSGDYRERLSAWKGWQVDMRDWAGCQNAQVAI